MKNVNCLIISIIWPSLLLLYMKYYIWKFKLYSTRNLFVSHNVYCPAHTLKIRCVQEIIDFPPHQIKLLCAEWSPLIMINSLRLRMVDYYCYLLLGKCHECHCAVNRLDLHRADAITDLLCYAVRRKILTVARVVIFVPTCFIQTRYCLACEHAKVNKIKLKKKKKMKTRCRHWKIYDLFAV